MLSCAVLSLSEAMNFNFGLAALTDGTCIMRFDDTNPEAEKLDYIEQILRNLQWLGHQPARITYSSDYFPQLYELAVKLIKSGHAYIDHQTAAEIKASRDYKEGSEGSKAASPWRDRPVEESLRLFDDMRKGKFDEGAATLRMKGDLSHPNPQMWDLVAYRIKYAEHPHVGDRWCIYPSYDYTHWSAYRQHTAAPDSHRSDLVISVMSFTPPRTVFRCSACLLFQRGGQSGRHHSLGQSAHTLAVNQPAHTLQRCTDVIRCCSPPSWLWLRVSRCVVECCTLEFEVRRESYYWLLDVLDLYKPKVWEYSRLNVEYNVMSKRRLLRLVEEGHVHGWDDPRLLTLNGLRRRGYTPEAIRDFCNAIGISRNETMIPQATLEHWLRNDLETKAKRAMCVVDPVRVVLTNYPADRVEQLSAPDFPKAPQLGSHTIPLSRVLYIDREDVRLQDDKSFFGLAVGKEVHLKYAYNIRCDKIDVAADDPTRITLVHCTVDTSNASKPKGKLHWVAEPQPGHAPQAVTLRLYDNLFLSKARTHSYNSATHCTAYCSACNTSHRTQHTSCLRSHLCATVLLCGVVLCCCCQDPMEVDNWLGDLNPDSLSVVSSAMADPSIVSAPAGTLFQFERVAYFVVDPDSDNSSRQYVLNRTVNLKESKPKTDKHNSAATTATAAAATRKGK